MNRVILDKLDIKDYAYLNFDNNPNNTTIVVGKEDSGKKYSLVAEKRSVDIAMFHEMGHWYHFLRDQNRFATENSGDNNKPEELLSGIGKFYYDKEIEGHDKSERVKVSAESWARVLSMDLGLSIVTIVTYEEMRNILGVNPNSENYKNGDDLCENLYRACSGTFIRFSHINEPYYEDFSVITNVLKILESTENVYTKGIIAFSNSKNDDTDFTRRGLGNCYRKNVEKKTDAKKKKRSGTINEILSDEEN